MLQSKKPIIHQIIRQGGHKKTLLKKEENRGFQRRFFSKFRGDFVKKPKKKRKKEDFRGATNFFLVFRSILSRVSGWPTIPKVKNNHFTLIE